jgi:Zn-dependent M28 family amino/carboxypeptidase
LLTTVEGILPAGTTATIVRWLAFLSALPAAAYGLGMGANLAGGRFSRRPSTGAVDNGTAVAILLTLARRLHRRDLRLDRTAVTFLLTVGEEAQMQGALAYARVRDRWSQPTYVVNLEVMGQDGGYALWEEDGTAMVRMPTDPAINRALERAINAVTREQPVRVPTVSSDSFAFLHRGIPATTLGSFDTELGGRGFHSAMDNLDRVDLERLEEAVEILSHFLRDVDSEKP